MLRQEYRLWYIALDATVSKVLLALNILYEFCRCFHRSCRLIVFTGILKRNIHRHSNTINAYWYFFSIEQYHRNNIIQFRTYSSKQMSLNLPTRYNTSNIIFKVLSYIFLSELFAILRNSSWTDFSLPGIFKS